MSEKRKDEKNRWRNKVVAFRMSPEEAKELDDKVALSGLSKQDYIIECLLHHEIHVVCGRKVAKEMQMYLEAILEELQEMNFSEEKPGDLDEVIHPLKHILRLLDEKSDFKQ